MIRNNPFGAITLLWTESFCEKDLWIFDKIRDIGYTSVDIAIGNPVLFPVRETARELKNTGLFPVLTKALPAEYNPISPDRSVRAGALDYFKRIIDIAYEIDCGLIGGVIYTGWGYRTGRPRTHTEWAQSVEFMRAAAEYAAPANIVLAPEVINRYVTHILNTAEDAIKYCDCVGMDNVKVHLDTFHMMIEENSMAEAIRRCGKEKLAYLHTCENHRGIPGTGMVPWREVFSTLEEIDYAGPMAIESYAPSFTRLAANSCIWRSFSESGEDFARRGYRNLMEIISEL